jgi:hypothetical protein
VGVRDLDTLLVEPPPDVRQHARAERGLLVGLVRPVAEPQQYLALAELADVTRRRCRVPGAPDADVRPALDDVVDLETGPLEEFAATVEKQYEELAARLEDQQQRESAPLDRTYV